MYGITLENGPILQISQIQYNIKKTNIEFYSLDLRECATQWLIGIFVFVNNEYAIRRVVHNKCPSRDQDNDGMRDASCAQVNEAGWWFDNCWFALLNGPYYVSLQHWRAFII